MPLLSRLLILVGIALLPALGALVWGAREEGRAREVAAQEEVMRTARLMAAEQQRLADGARQLLTVMGNLRAVRALDPAECQAFFRRIMEDFPRYTVLAIADLEGRVVCSAQGRAIGNGVADREYFRRALEEGGFVTGGYVMGRASGQGSFHFSQPIHDTAGRVAGVVHAGIGLGWLGEQVNRLPLPASSVLAIVDRDGVVLAARPGRGQTVGEPARGTVGGLLDQASPGVFDRTGSDGRRRLYGVIPADVTDTHTIVVGLDRKSLLAGAAEAMRRGAAILLITTVLALLLTVLGARRLLREPVARLLAAADRWRRGDTAARIEGVPARAAHGQGTEFDRLGGAFNAMAEAVEVRERTLHEKEEADARLAAIVTSAADAIISLSPADGTIMSWNRGAEDLFGYAAAEVLGRRIDLLLPPGDEAGPLYRRALSGETIRDQEAVRVAWDGTRIPVSITLAAMRGQDGRAIGVSVILRDLRERRAADEQQRLLMREVDHRARNVMSVVRSLVQLSPKEDPAAFARAIEGRISAMARAHGLLARDRWEGASFRSLAEQELGGTAGSLDQAELDGPAVTLRPDAVQPLSMVLHELVTNSTKYGALSHAAGRVGLRWQAERTEAGPALVIHWEERGGPPVDPPSRRGFGSRLIEISVRHQLHGAVLLEWRRTGLVAAIRVGAGCVAAIAAGEEPRPEGAAPGPARDSGALRNLRVLVVEDEALVAVEVVDVLAAAGCRIIGPAATLAEALAAARGAGEIDAAVLDVKLGADPVLPLADELVARGVPVLFTTGYDEPPPGHGGAPVLTKPIHPEALVRAVTELAIRNAARP